MTRRRQVAQNRRKYGPALVFVLLTGLVGCRDLGTNPITISPAPPPRGTVSFRQTVEPIFADQRVGCLGCHGGTNDLFVRTQADLLRGGLHGPAVVPGNSAQSLLVQKMGPNPPFGDRMPFGSNPLPDSTIQIIRDWIDQGALDN
jgi:hypothetical protein